MIGIVEDFFDCLLMLSFLRGNFHLGAVLLTTNVPVEASFKEDWGILPAHEAKLPSTAGRRSCHLEKGKEASDGFLGASLSCALQIQQGEGGANEKLFGSKPLLSVCGLLVWLKINFPVGTLRVTVLWWTWVLYS